MRVFSSLILINILLFSQTINEQIHALEDASPEKRVELMNHIKEQLITMNQEERMKTINTLRAKLQPKESSGQHQMHVSSESEHKDTKSESLEHHERQEQMMHHNGETSELHQELHHAEQERILEGSLLHSTEHQEVSQKSNFINKGR